MNSAFTDWILNSLNTVRFSVEYFDFVLGITGSGFYDFNTCKISGKNCKPILLSDVINEIIHSALNNETYMSKSTYTDEDGGIIDTYIIDAKSIDVIFVHKYFYLYDNNKIIDVFVRVDKKSKINTVGKFCRRIFDIDNARESKLFRQIVEREINKLSLSDKLYLYMKNLISDRILIKK